MPSKDLYRRLSMGAGTMIIAQISDTHIALDVPDADRRMSDLALTVADINALDPLPDAIVHTGDVAHNGRQDEYEAAKAILANARAPVYLLAGNKDNRTNLHAAFLAGEHPAPGCNFIQYAIDRYPVRLIALDTQGSGNKGEFCRERLEHLTDLLAADAAKPTAVFTHHPPFLVTEGPEAFHFENWDAMSSLRRALSRLGQVVGVFSGHVHRAVSGDVEGIPAMVLPAIATTLRHGVYPVHLKNRPVYQIHRFDPVCGFVSETRIAVGHPHPVTHHQRDPEGEWTGLRSLGCIKAKLAALNSK